MPQSLSNLLVHLVFSTKNRTPNLTKDVRDDLYAYLTGILKNLNCPLIQTGGVEDHVHLLFNLHRTAPLSLVVEKLKTGSTKWLKANYPKLEAFSWQGGYGAFSVGTGEIWAVIRYIQDQEEHHKRVSFQDELRALLQESGLVFDERYLWD